MMNLVSNFWKSSRSAMVGFFAGAEVLGRKGFLAGFLGFDEVVMFKEIGGKVAGGGGYRHLTAVQKLVYGFSNYQIFRLSDSEARVLETRWRFVGCLWRFVTCGKNGTGAGSYLELVEM